MNKKHVAVAMSGGVDSAVAAALALKANFQVTAVHLKMEADQPDDPILRACCEKLGIELVEHDCATEFYEKVLKDSALEYASGRTPNPCCQCNKVLKFAELLKAADALGIREVFTGHYVNLSCENGIYTLRKGADPAKDQSYFLYLLTQEELSRVNFPLGQLTKAQVREIAAAENLPCAVRKDSQDACFQIPGECCGETLRRRCNLTLRKGRFIHNGKVVGKHNGIHRYTLGQRNGLNVALGVPAYIKSIDPVSGNIELTTNQDELMSNSFTVKKLSWQSGSMPKQELTVRVRYRSAGISCTLEKLDAETYKVTPQSPLRAVTPGQAAVFYAGDILAGGGVIDHV